MIEYPNMETYQEKVKELEKLDWWRYFSGKSILGHKNGTVVHGRRSLTGIC